MKAHPSANAFRMFGDSELKALAADIKENGQEQPIVTWRDEIVDGRNRYAACQLAGVEPWIEERAFKDDAEVAWYVLSMNVHRRHLGETGRSMAVAYFLPTFEEAAKKRQGWRGAEADEDLVVNLPQGHKSRDDAAAIANVSPSSVQFAKKVRNHGEPEIVEATCQEHIAVSAAAKLVNEPRETQLKVLELIKSGEAKNPKGALLKLRTANLAKTSASAPRVEGGTILQGNSVDLLPTVATAHCVVMDPPYGLENHHANFDHMAKDYEDGEDYALEILRGVCERLLKVCAPDAHLYVFTGYSNAWAFKEILADFFDVQENPLIWAKNTHSPCDFSKRYPSSYELIWFAKMRGSKRPLAKLVKDVIFNPTERSTSHSAEKPTDLLQLLIEQSTVAGEHVIDPFCGSGSTGVAALRCKRHFTGIELDPEWADVARGRLVRDVEAA
jgi:DNA modification methylase